MGNYTKVDINVHLKTDNEESLALIKSLSAILGYSDIALPKKMHRDILQNGTSLDQVISTHPFFSMPRWSHLLTNDENVYSYTITDLVLSMYDYGSPYLHIHSTLKNYDNEIELFLSLIKNHISKEDGRYTHVATVRPDVWDDGNVVNNPTTVMYDHEEGIYIIYGGTDLVTTTANGDW